MGANTTSGRVFWLAGLLLLACGGRDADESDGGSALETDPSEIVEASPEVGPETGPALDPVAGSDRYWLGSPMLTRAEFALPTGTLVIEAPAASPENVYVTAVTLDGQPLAGPYVTHCQLAGAHTLRFEMAAAPASGL